jgi:Flp pilus assembly protein TadG
MTGCYKWAANAKQFRRDERGTTALEFAIVGTLFTGLCLAILQLGWALQVRNEMAKAADQAVRYVLLNPTADDASFKEQIYTALRNYNRSKLNVVTGQTVVGANTLRVLTVRYDFALSIPAFPANLVTLRVSRRAPKL